MTRIDDEILALHLEVALATVPPTVLEGLSDTDYHRRHAAFGEIARELVERLYCFDICRVGGLLTFRQPTLFPHDLGPIG